MAQTYNIHVDQGATYSLTINYVNSAGVAIDLTGYDARMQVRETVSSTTVLATYTTPAASGIDATSAGSGRFILGVTSAQTAAFDFTNAVYDMEVYDASVPPDVIRIVQGRFVVNPEVTR